MNNRLQAISKAISTENGKTLAHLLSFERWDDAFIASIKNDFFDPQTFVHEVQLRVGKFFNSEKLAPWENIISEHIQSCIALKGFSNPTRAFTSLKTAVLEYATFVNEKDNPAFWTQPLFELFIKQLYSVSGKEQKSLNGKRNIDFKIMLNYISTILDCLVIYRTFFSIVKHKPKAKLCLVNENFRICFKVCLINSINFIDPNLISCEIVTKI